MNGTALGSPGQTTYVNQGEFAISAEQGRALSTILGSCVATCIFDPEAKIGGMNHFLLPDRSSGRNDSGLYGVHLMELLINGLMRAGASKHLLCARLFGGASLIGASSDVGARNAQFARSFLQVEGIKLVEESLGGAQGRRISFTPHDGEARERLIAKYDDPEPAPISAPAREESDVELF